MLYTLGSAIGCLFGYIFFTFILDILLTSPYSISNSRTKNKPIIKSKICPKLDIEYFEFQSISTQTCPELVLEDFVSKNENHTDDFNVDFYGKMTSSLSQDGAFELINSLDQLYSDHHLPTICFDKYPNRKKSLVFTNINYKNDLINESEKLEEENLNLQESITELKDSIRRKLIEVAKSNGKHIDEELKESDLSQFFGEGEEELLETVRELLGIGKKISKKDGGAQNDSKLGNKYKMTLRDAISELSQDDEFLSEKNGGDITDEREKTLGIDQSTSSKDSATLKSPKLSESDKILLLELTKRNLELKTNQEKIKKFRYEIDPEECTVMLFYGDSSWSKDSAEALSKVYYAAQNLPFSRFIFAKVVNKIVASSKESSRLMGYNVYQVPQLLITSKNIYSTNSHILQKFDDTATRREKISEHMEFTLGKKYRSKKHKSKQNSEEKTEERNNEKPGKAQNLSVFNSGGHYDPMTRISNYIAYKIKQKIFQLEKENLITTDQAIQLNKTADERTGLQNSPYYDLHPADYFSNNFNIPSRKEYQQCNISFKDLTSEQLALKMAKILGQFSSPVFYPVKENKEKINEMLLFTEKYQAYYWQRVVFDDKFLYYFCIFYILSTLSMSWKMDQNFRGTIFGILEEVFSKVKLWFTRDRPQENAE